MSGRNLDCLPEDTFPHWTGLDSPAAPFMPLYPQCTTISVLKQQGQVGAE